MVMALQKYSGLPAKNKVVGMAGIIGQFKVPTFFIFELQSSSKRN